MWNEKHFSWSESSSLGSHFIPSPNPPTTALHHHSVEKKSGHSSGPPAFKKEGKSLKELLKLRSNCQANECAIMMKYTQRTSMGLSASQKVLFNGKYEENTWKMSGKTLERRSRESFKDAGTSCNVELNSLISFYNRIQSESRSLLASQQFTTIEKCTKNVTFPPRLSHLQRSGISQQKLAPEKVFAAAFVPFFNSIQFPPETFPH